VPVDAVARVVPQLIARGRYAPPALGITGDVRADAMLRASGAPPGVVVMEVLPGGPAESAGLVGARMTDRGFVPGDVIEAMDGAAVATLDDVLARLDRHAPGDTVLLSVRRGRDRREVRVELAPDG
jgi:S1-C subfamily serine protease